MGIEYKFDGDKYLGEWKNNKYNGFGIEIKSNGKISKGEFKNNVKLNLI